MGSKHINYNKAHTNTTLNNGGGDVLGTLFIKII